MDVQRAVIDIEMATASQDWGTVVSTGDLLLDADRSLRPWTQAMRGRALFSLGRNAEAADAFDEALSTPPEGINLTESLYFAGMAAKLSGDVDRALGFLRRGQTEGDPRSWASGAIARGFAQIALDRDLLDEAWNALAELPEDRAQRSMHHVIRARIRVGQDDRNGARNELTAARQVVGVARDATPAQAATVCGMMTVAGAMYLELGDAEDARTVLEIAEYLFDRAGRRDIPPSSYIPMFLGGVCRLEGDLDGAERLLEECRSRPFAAPDVEPLLMRETARVVWDRGDPERARELLARAAARFEELGYAMHARRVRGEMTDGPPKAPDPDALPDGVFVSIEAKDADRIRELVGLTDRLTDVVAAAVAGEVDGWEAGEGTFVIYLYGDPDRLWNAIEQPLTTSLRGARAEITKRKNGRSKKFFA